MKRIGQITETQAAPKYNESGRLISKACRQLARKTFGKLENNTQLNLTNCDSLVIMETYETEEKHLAH